MNIEKTLRYGVLGAIFLLPFVAFFVSNSMFFPFITGKNFAFRILTELIVGGWLILALYNPSYRPKRSWLLWAIAAFVAIIGIANLGSPNVLKSFWSNFERMEGWVTLLHLLGLFLAASSMLNTEKLWRRLFATSIGVSVLMGLYSIAQLAGFIVINQGGVRVDATFGNAIYLAVYMLFHIFLTLWLWYKHKGATAWYWVYGAIILLQTFILFQTATRGTILGLLGGLFLTALIIALFERERRVIRKTALGAVIAVVVLVAGFFALRDTAIVRNNLTLNRLADISLTEGTTQARFLVWGVAMKGFQEKPLLGWGQESFNFVFNKYYDPRLEGQEVWFDRAHNIIFDWLTAGGILGLLAYISMLGIALYYLWRSPRKNIQAQTALSHGFSPTEKGLLTGLLAGYFFHNLFAFDNIISYILFFLVLAYIHHRATNTSPAPVPPAPQHITQTKHILAAVIIIATLFSVYLFNAKGMGSSRALIRALQPQPTAADTAMHYEQALAYEAYGTQEVREQLAQFAVRIANAPAIGEQDKQAFFTFALDQMQKQAQEVPGDARIHSFIATLFTAYGLFDQALAEYHRVLELSPDKPDTLFQIGAVYLQQGDFDVAFEIFKQAYELVPDSEDTLQNYAAAAIFVGRDDLAEELLIPEFGTTLISEPLFINAYASRGQYDIVAELWRMRVAGDPGNIQHRLSLAASLLEIQNRPGAIEQIEEIIAINPGFAQQGEALINEIRAGRNP